MQSIIPSALPRLTADKILHNLQFTFTTRLESSRVVENIAGVFCEDQFIIDFMQATLQTASSRSDVTDKNESV
jgi:hypothetical protein